MKLHAFWLALQFLTRLPVPCRTTPSGPVAGLSMITYPLVGLVIGALLAGVGWMLNSAPASLFATLILMLWVVVTGGLHLDGLADSADAWMGGQGNRERTLEIMKDTHSGSAAVIAILLILLTKFAALAEIKDVSKFSALLLAPIAGRSAIIALVLTTPYVRHGGLGSLLVEYLPRKLAWLVVGFVVLLIVFSLGPIVMLPIIVLIWLLRHLMVQRIGGCTGDTLGAGVEITETTLLVATVLAGS